MLSALSVWGRVTDCVADTLSLVSALPTTDESRDARDVETRVESTPTLNQYSPSQSKIRVSYCMYTAAVSSHVRSRSLERHYLYSTTRK